MTNLDNLNRFRKARALEEKRAEADANAVRFGQTKAEKILLATRSDRAMKMLDQHKMEDE